MNWKHLTTIVALLCACSFALPAQTAVETYTYSYNGRPLGIYVDDANIITLVSLGVPRSIKLRDVKATIDIDYPRPGDLNVYLYSPEGTRTKLLERNCGDQGSLRRITFDDSAPNKYSEACPGQAGGSFRGNEPLANSRDQNGAGLWVLAVENNGSNDYFGWILGFTLTLTGEVYANPTTVSDLIVNAASLMGGPVAPGELVSIYGTNLGPGTPVEVKTGNLPTTLGGTEVMLNETKLPIKFASKYRVDVQVPYLVGVPGDLWVTVSYGGGSSNPVNLTTQTAKPGLLSINPTGLGQLEAVNADGSLNKDQAAARGSEVTVYASGLGVTQPSIQAGQAPPSRPTPVAYNTVSATVAGQPAMVIDASLVPDRPGVYAVRLQVPLATPVGVAEVKVSVASSSSQNGAYIRVR